MKSDKMKTKKYLILVLVVLFEIALSCDKRIAAGQGLFHSEANGYSLKLPEGWIKIPDNIVHTTMNRLLSEKGQSEIVIETAFQLEAEGLWFQYPYTGVQVVTYSSFGLNRQLNEGEFENHVKGMSGLDIIDYTEQVLTPIGQEIYPELAIGKIYLDSNKRLYLFGVEMELPSVGKIKGQVVGHFGRRSIIQVMFYDLESNWIQSKPERDFIFGSFQFDPAMAYNEAAESQVGFFERRAMEALPVIVLVLIVGGIAAAWGYIGRRIRQRDEQKQ